MTVQSDTEHHRVAEPGGGHGPPVAAIDDPRFRVWFVQHYPRVLAYAVRRVPDRAGAEDIAAETFLIAWRRRNTLPEDPLPWLLATARNLITNDRRARTRRQDIVERVGREPSHHHEPDKAHNALSPVTQALDSLRARDREVLMLTSWDGLDNDRAAAVLGCSPGTFAVRLHRARKRLAAALDALPTIPQEN